YARGDQLYTRALPTRRSSDLPLLPGEPLLRAQVRELQHLIGCDIHPLQNLRVLKHLRAEFGQDDAGVEEWCRKWIGAGFEAYEADRKSTRLNSSHVKTSYAVY